MMLRAIELLLWLFVAVYILAVNTVLVSYGVCNTPFGFSGHCVPLSDCPSLYNLLAQANDDNDIFNHLRNSFCGSDVNATSGPDRTRVCCRDNPNAENKDKESGKMLPTPGTCGITFNMRIFGGVESQVDEFPWSALIKYQRHQKENESSEEALSSRCGESRGNTFRCCNTLY
uniref:Serine protease easter n=1 Tax=Bactrocera latifrons TaxID=174628 RepID=A0A0K8VIE9_BACLA